MEEAKSMVAYAYAVRGVACKHHCRGVVTPKGGGDPTEEDGAEASDSSVAIRVSLGFTAADFCI